MRTFPARLFGPGLPPAGQDASLRAAAGQLQIVAPSMRLPTQQVALRRIGFDGKGIELGWHSAEGAWAVQVLDAAQADDLLAALPEALHPARASLQAGAKRVARRRGLGWAALGLFLAAPLLLLLGFFVFADPIAGWVAGHIPLAQERQLGEASFASMKPTLKLQEDTEAARVVREIGGRLTQGSPYRYTFHVADNPQVNAFAIPGGIVVVHSGLIAATTRAEELAGVLAHEVQHVELRHSLKGLVKQLGLGTAWALLSGDITGGLAGQAAQQMMSLAFSREAEREADERGLDALIRAGIDPSGMPAFFKTLGEKNMAPPAILSTHPDSTERQERLAALLRERSPQTVAPLPYSPWPPLARQ